MKCKLLVQINRNPISKKDHFMDYFHGFEQVNIVKQILGKNAEDILKNLKIEFSIERRYMGVNGGNGRIIISVQYLKTGNIFDLYLDLIHELVHVKQFLEGKELFDKRFNYVERPTEIEAFRYTIEEAKKLGLTNNRIYEYLKQEWLNTEDIQKLAKILKLDI